MLESAVAADAGDIVGFEAFYASRGIAALAIVCDGDCGLDVMTMMLGLPQTFASRTALRIEISDYLTSRTGEPWMHELMVALQEAQQEDVIKHRSGGITILASPIAPAPAVVEPAKESSNPENVAAPAETSCAPMRWASRLQNGSAVMSLIRALPTGDRRGAGA